MSTKLHNLYRVYDHKSNYIQSYSSETPEGLKFAKDCATRMNGRVDEITRSGSEESISTVFSASLKTK